MLSFDVTASMALTLGIPILNAQIVMGVTVTFIYIEFPFTLGLDISNFGLSGAIGIDIRVLQLSIFLQFKLCAGFSIFQVCFSTTLFSFGLTAWEYEQEFMRFGTGSSS
eukprot:1086824_1